MARTKGAQDIKGWREHCLLRDLALGEETPEELADKYGVELQSIYAFRWRNKHRIAVVLAEYSNEFSDLWSVKKHARISDLQALADALQARIDEMYEDAARETEVMRQVHPDAAPVRVSVRDLRGLIRDKARLEAQIERSLGQDPQTIAALAGDAYMMTRMKLLGLWPKPGVLEQGKRALGPEAPPEGSERPLGAPSSAELRSEFEANQAVKLAEIDANIAAILDRAAAKWPEPEIEEPEPVQVLEPQPEREPEPEPAQELEEPEPAPVRELVFARNAAEQGPTKGFVPEVYTADQHDADDGMI